MAEDWVCNPCSTKFISGNIIFFLSFFKAEMIQVIEIIPVENKDLFIVTWLLMPWRRKQPGPWFNIKMLSYQYRKSHCGDKTVVRSSYLHNRISYTGKMTYLHWIGALDISSSQGIRWQTHTHRSSQHNVLSTVHHMDHTVNGSFMLP